MSNGNDEKKDYVEYFAEHADKFGAACSTVKDGHVLLFKLDFLQKLLDDHPDQNQILIFLKRPDFKN